MALQFEDVKLYKWYSQEPGPYLNNNPIFVFKKIEDEKRIHTVEFDNELTGGFIIKGYKIKWPWRVVESDFKLPTRYRRVLVKFILKCPSRCFI
jgi:hypothetical protein